jgi:hypothetical protein
MSEISDEEIKELIQGLDDLEEIPEEAAKRFDETIQRLLIQDAIIPRKKRSPWGNLALAASFVLLIGVGATFFTQERLGGVSSTSISSAENDIEFQDDEILTSESEQISTSKSFVPEFESDINYEFKLNLDAIPFNLVATYGSTANLDSTLIRCIRSIGLVDAVSFIDRSKYGELDVISVWSALSGNTWQIAIIDFSCNPVDKIIFKR